MKLTDNAAEPVEWVKDVVYGPAGEMTALKYWTGFSYRRETRSYNLRLQMTRQTVEREFAPDQWAMVTDYEYRYPTSTNNGRITQKKDWVSGEEVTYAYDSLNRLISAVTTGPEWGQSFAYDGFGNLTAQTATKGTAPSMTLSISGTTNRITTAGYSYDANG